MSTDLKKDGKTIKVVFATNKLGDTNQHDQT